MQKSSSVIAQSHRLGSAPLRGPDVDDHVTVSLMNIAAGRSHPPDV